MLNSVNVIDTYKFTEMLDNIFMNLTSFDTSRLGHII